MYKFAIIAVLMFCATSMSFGQEPEVFLGGDQNLRLPTREPENYLAKCMSNPTDRIACYLAANNKTDGGLESAVNGQMDAMTYVACSQTGGVCLEVARMDWGAAPKREDARTHIPQTKTKLHTVDIRILFDYDKASLRAFEISKLAQIATALKHPNTSSDKFAIIGHTDAKGTNSYNCSLSQARARSVKTKLVTLGVSSDRLTVIGAGKYVLRNSTDGAAPENRRVGFAKLSRRERQITDRLAALCRQ